MKEINIQPILKWVGGKRQLLKDIVPLITQHRFSTYVEPFIGGGAVLFDISPQNAVINDFNAELINLYTVIKNKPEELINALTVHSKNHNKDYYYEIRGWDREDTYSTRSDIEKAARTVYLNKTCFNGLYRVNSNGYFNSPCGDYKNPNIINADLIRNLSSYFNKANIIMHCGDYKQTLQNLDSNAFVYLDPPYMPISKSASFVGYTKGGFDYEKQKELKVECDKLTTQGIRFLQSNSDCSEIRELYKDYTIITVQANRHINSDASKRGAINEVLIHNFNKVVK